MIDLLLNLDLGRGLLKITEEEFSGPPMDVRNFDFLFHGFDLILGNFGSYASEVILDYR